VGGRIIDDQFTIDNLRFYNWGAKPVAKEILIFRAEKCALKN
jgi:hypothetical protein